MMHQYVRKDILSSKQQQQQSLLQQKQQKPLATMSASHQQQQKRQLVRVKSSDGEGHLWVCKSVSDQEESNTTMDVEKEIPSVAFKNKDEEMMYYLLKSDETAQEQIFTQCYDMLKQGRFQISGSSEHNEHDFDEEDIHQIMDHEFGNLSTSRSHLHKDNTHIQALETLINDDHHSHASISEKSSKSDPVQNHYSVSYL